MDSTIAGRNDGPLELFYRPLRTTHRGLSFPCDAAGCVDLDGLSERERRDYLYARVVTGDEFARPIVRPTSAFPFLLLTDFGR